MVINNSSFYQATLFFFFEQHLCAGLVSVDGPHYVKITDNDWHFPALADGVDFLHILVCNNTMCVIQTVALSKVVHELFNVVLILMGQ